MTHDTDSQFQYAMYDQQQAQCMSTEGCLFVQVDEATEVGYKLVKQFENVFKDHCKGMGYVIE
jgi:hypothetical protein